MKCSGTTRSGRNCRKNAVISGSFCRDHTGQEAKTNETAQFEAFDAIEHHKRKAFLIAYAQCGTLKGAAEAAGIGRTVHYNWLGQDDYAEAFTVADRMAGKSLEDEAVKRAFDGSDTLLIFLLKGAMPDKYKDRQHIQTDAKVIVTKAQVENYENVTEEELEALRSIAIKLAQPRAVRGTTKTQSPQQVN